MNIIFIIFIIIFDVFLVFIAYSSSTPIISSNKEIVDINEFKLLYPSFSQTEVVSDNSEKASKQDGWRGIINGNWHKHGDEDKNEYKMKKYDHLLSENYNKKKYEKSDNKNVNKIWSRGKKGGHRSEEISKMEYIKDKGHYYEKQWSWDRESGTKHSYGKESQSNKEHDKGDYNANHSKYHENKENKEDRKEHESHMNENQEGWDKSHTDTRNYKEKILSTKNFDENSWWSTPSQRIQTWLY